MSREIIIWRWVDAPAELKALSTHGGDEDWLAVVPRVLCDTEGLDYDWPRTPTDDDDREPECEERDAWPLPSILHPNTAFGAYDVSVYAHPTRPGEFVIAIGAHA